MPIVIHEVQGEVLPERHNGASQVERPQAPSRPSPEREIAEQQRLMRRLQSRQLRLRAD